MFYMDGGREIVERDWRLWNVTEAGDDAAVGYGHAAGDEDVAGRDADDVHAQVRWFTGQVHF